MNKSGGAIDQWTDPPRELATARDRRKRPEVANQMPSEHNDRTGDMYRITRKKHTPVITI